MSRRGQSGVAVVTALLVVAVSAAAAGLMLSQQSAMLGQVAMLSSRAQADAYAQAGLDWARGVLSQDARQNSIDSLGEGWAQPIAGLPIERAVVAGAITDAQGRFNLNNLVDGGRRSDADYATFKRLLSAVGLAPELADAVVDWIDPDGDLSGPGGAEDAYYLSLPRPSRTANQPMQQFEELHRVRGFDAKAVAKLKPYVSALPLRTKVNANTAPAPVLEALLPQVPAEVIAAFVSARREKPANTREELGARLGPKADTGALQALDVRSAWFDVFVTVAQDDVQLATDALVVRGENAVATLAWRRPRF